MKIRLNEKHYLNSDERSFWITEITKGKRGGEREKRVSGYCDTFERAVEDFIDTSVGRTTASTLKKLKEEIKELKKEVREFKNKGE